MVTVVMPPASGPSSIRTTDFSLRQQIGGRQAGDAGADNANVGLDVLIERTTLWHFDGLGPNGCFFCSLQSISLGFHKGLHEWWLMHFSGG